MGIMTGQGAVWHRCDQDAPVIVNSDMAHQILEDHAAHSPQCLPSVAATAYISARDDSDYE